MLKKYKDKIIVGLLILVFGIVGFYITNYKDNDGINNENISLEDNSSKETNSSIIFVHVDGEVNKPGIYEFKTSHRVDDAIKKAGNTTSNADLKNINLAQKLTDEMKIYIPNIDNENLNLNEESNNILNSVNDLININSATKDNLMTLPGIGSSKADAIINYREETGFIKIEDLLNVSGIGEKTFDKLKELITVY